MPTRGAVAPVAIRYVEGVVARTAFHYVAVVGVPLGPHPVVVAFHDYLVIDPVAHPLVDEVFVAGALTGSGKAVDYLVLCPYGAAP